MTVHRNRFWHDALTLEGSITPHVFLRVLVFGAFAAVVCFISRLMDRYYQLDIGLEVAPYEIAGGALSLLLILRTNAGYDRWWEGRKLWGGIVNQSRNLAIDAVAYGPNDAQWRENFIRWTAAFGHVARCSLRGEAPALEVVSLVGQENADRMAASNHIPSYVAGKLGEMLREACEKFNMDRFAFLQLDKERALLIDHIGGCERILKTPLPRVYSMKIRQFIVMFLLTLPFALLHRIGSDWLVPFITLLVAYPLVSLDQIGIELQNPFSVASISHLPLNDISATIENNLMGKANRA